MKFHRDLILLPDEPSRGCVRGKLRRKANCIRRNERKPVLKHRAGTFIRHNHVVAERAEKS